MLCFFCDFQKQNTLRIYWLRVIFLFFRFSLRKAADRLSDCFIKRNHVSIWIWIQKYNPQKISSKKKKIQEYIIDETVIKAGSESI